MMNCWKTINFSQQYGQNKLLIMSLFTMLLSFIFLYVPVAYLTVSPLKSNHFLLLVLSLFFMYPLHKLFHYLPILHLRNRVKKTVKFYGGVMPIISVRVHEPLRKWTFLLALFCPFFLIGMIISSGFILLPNYNHYLTILLSYHIGMCVPDFIRAKNVLFAPHHSYIEENDEGFEILVRKAS
ncbi:DUF3267 domain-containing protein [Pseudoneobacillus sp. C159]